MVDVVEETDVERDQQQNAEWWIRMHQTPVRYDPDAIEKSDR